MKSYKPFPETITTLLDLAGISRREAHRRAERKGWAVSQKHANRLFNGETEVAPEHMEAVARGLNIEPETFLEYRLWQARCAYDPREVGFKQAVANLRRLERAAGDEDEEPIPPAELDDALSGEAAAEVRAGPS